MRAARSLAVTCVCLAGAVLAGAQEPPRRPILGERIPEIIIKENEQDKGEPFLEPYRRRIVVLFFFRTDDSRSIEMLPMISKLDKEYGRKGVVFLGMTPQKKEKVDAYFKEKPTELRVIYWRLGPLIFEVTAYPRILMIDTRGVLVDRFDPAEGLEEKIETQLRRTPPPPLDAESMSKRMRGAAEFMGKRDFARAFTLARDVNDLSLRDSDLAKSSKELMDQIREAAKKQFEEIRKQIADKEYETACRTLAEYSVRFVKTDVGEEADKEVARLLGDRDMKPIMAKAKDNARGTLWNEEAAELMAEERYLEAMKRFRDVTEDFPDTEAGKLADAALERMKGDSKILARIARDRAEDEAQRWLDLGDRFAKAKMYRRAREFYNRVLENHAESPVAERVKERMKTLPPDEEADAEGSSDTAGKDSPGHKEKQ